MKHVQLKIVALAGIAAAACAPVPESDDGIQIAMHSDTWEEALNAGDIDTLVSLYTDTARVLPPNGELSAGRDAVRAEFAAMTDAGLSGELTTIEARQAGDIGYNVGLYTLADGDGTAVDRGKFIEIWRREDDGQWRISNDIWNSDLPVASHEQPETRETVLTVIHEVEDPARWLAAWRGANSRRATFAEHGAAHVHVFQDSEDPNLTGLVISVSDEDALMAFLESDAGAAAAAGDGVRMDTLRLFREVR